MQHRISRWVGERDGLRVGHCATCEFAHLDPLPDEGELATFYRDEFWQSEKPGAVETIDAQLDWWRRVWDLWLTEARRVSFGGATTLLDLGAGHGHFVRHATDRGWDASGVEPNDVARRYAVETLGVRMIEVGEAGLPADVGADVVSATWVLEHLHDPEGFLGDLAFRADVLVLAAPNEFTEVQIAADKVAAVRNWWVHRTHVNYFTKDSLKSLFRRTGWIPVTWYGTFPMETFISAGQDYIGTAGLGPQLHQQVREDELDFTDEQFRKDYIDRGKSGTGRDLIAVCKSEWVR